MNTRLDVPATELLSVFQIDRIGQLIEENPFCKEISCKKDQYKIVWFTQGSGIYDSGIRSVEVIPGTIYCLDPAQFYKVYIGADADGFILSFKEKFLTTGENQFDLTCQSTLFKLFSRAEGLCVYSELQTDLQEIVLRMLKEYDGVCAFKGEIVKRYLKIFLIYLVRAFDGKYEAIKANKTVVLVEKFIDRLENDFKTRKMVADYADTLFVTPNYLNEMVKRNTGFPASYHIRQRVVAEAKRMALRSDRTLKEIAYALGFADCAHFSKYFKATTGSNFRDFKRQQLTTVLMA